MEPYTVRIAWASLGVLVCLIAIVVPELLNGAASMPDAVLTMASTVHNATGGKSTPTCRTLTGRKHFFAALHSWMIHSDSIQGCRDTALSPCPSFFPERGTCANDFRSTLGAFMWPQPPAALAHLSADYQSLEVPAPASSYSVSYSDITGASYGLVAGFAMAGLVVSCKYASDTLQESAPAAVAAMPLSSALGFLVSALASVRYACREPAIKKLHVVCSSAPAS